MELVRLPVDNPKKVYVNKDRIVAVQSVTTYQPTAANANATSEHSVVIVADGNDTLRYELPFPAHDVVAYLVGFKEISVDIAVALAT
jgi:hypothetical protein